METLALMKPSELDVPLLVSQEVQWFEFYNTTDREIIADLYLLFTPFKSHIERETVHFDGTDYKVLDALSTLFRWEVGVTREKWQKTHDRLRLGLPEY